MAVKLNLMLLYAVIAYFTLVDIRSWWKWRSQVPFLFRWTMYFVLLAALCAAFISAGGLVLVWVPQILMVTGVQTIWMIFLSWNRLTYLRQDWDRPGYLRGMNLRLTIVTLLSALTSVGTVLYLIQVWSDPMM
jgi:hypothetical protein